MITLYQFHWSHYVEKVRWALDYKGVKWTAVEVDPFTKRQMRHLKCKTTADSGARLYAVPAIFDAATGAVVSESSEILEYLERHYPSPALYPVDVREREEVARWMLWLDSALGHAARRLAYTQIALESPGLLAELFMPQRFGLGDGQRFKGRLAGAIIAGVLTQRFRFLHNRTDEALQKLEQCLLIAAQRLSSRPYLVGNQFTGADLTLAALSRPALLVPFIRNHPGLQQLFEWRANLVREHRREPQVAYEATMHEVRERRGWCLGAAGWLPAIPPHVTAPPPVPAIRNDHQSVQRWPLVTGSLWYLRLKAASDLERISYP